MGYSWFVCVCVWGGGGGTNSLILYTSDITLILYTSDITVNDLITQKTVPTEQLWISPSVSWRSHQRGPWRSPAPGWRSRPPGCCPQRLRECAGSCPQSPSAASCWRHWSRSMLGAPLQALVCCEKNGKESSSILTNSKPWKRPLLTVIVKCCCWLWSRGSMEQVKQSYSMHRKNWGNHDSRPECYLFCVHGF